MALEDIENLKERLTKNPDSKLFVPLAEEYRKAEMFDEAIDVLKQGLELQPSYMSARVALGKIYIEKEMLEEARSEFEEVIKTIPDNLFAHKKLAEIYKDLGDPISALKQYETVIGLNPLDDEAQISMEAIADAAEAAKAAKVAEAIEEKKREEELDADRVKEAMSEEEAVEDVPEQETQSEEVTAEETCSEAEDNAEENTGPGKEALVKDLVGDSGKNLGKDFEQFKETIESDVKPPDETFDEKPGKTALEGERETQMFFGGDSAPGAKTPEIKDEARESILPDDEEFLGKPVEEESILPDDEEYLGRPAPVEEESPEDKVIFGEPAPVESVSHEETAKVIEATGPAQQSDDIVSEIRRAEAMVEQSLFADAIKHYNGLMEKYPDDKRILQKLQELKVYLKMLGKDKEEVINKLQLFLNGIMMRKEKYEF